ncbi:hypothetical protein [Bradyrhizobium sp. USDA 4353]
MNDRSRSAPALEVRGLDVYYGHSHALQGVDLRLDSGVFSLVGRNGMGKTHAVQGDHGSATAVRRLGAAARQ